MGKPIKLTDEVYDKVDKVAKELNMPKAQLINMWVNNHKKRSKSEKK